MKILVIDDDDAVLKYIRDILRHDGINVLTTDNGLSAFEKLSRNCDVTAVITDIIMPEEEGIEIIKKSRPNTPTLKLSPSPVEEK